MKNEKSILKLNFKALALLWGLFILLDFFGEINIINYIILLLSLITFVSIVVVAYINYCKIEEKVTNNRGILILKFNVISILTWLIENIVIISIVIELVASGKWIIYQRPDVFLNGLEYIFFAIIITVFPIVVIIIAETARFIYRKIKSKKERKNNG